MGIFRVTGAMTIVSVLVTATAFAQTPAPPESSSAPSSASSPSQREATRSPAQESPASEPSSATTTHQREAMGGKQQTMKQCMDDQVTNHAGKSRSDMTMTCEEQMKKQKTPPVISKGPTTTMPKDEASR